MKTINPHARLWIAALRSPQYPQSKHPYAWLKDEDGFNALGVLCEIARNHGVIESYDPKQAIPGIVQKWVGLRVPLPVGICLDDGTFEELADILEKRADEIFLPVYRRLPFTNAQIASLRSLAIQYGFTLAALKNRAMGTGVRGEAVIVPLGKRWAEIDGKGNVT